MKLLHDTYLEQMNEELEIINYRLEKLHEAAFGETPTIQDEPISLLNESFDESEELEVLNEEAYQLYTEALDKSLSAIWNAIKRFIKMLFISSGEKISAAEAKRIIEVVRSASNDGSASGNIKSVAQKAFYMLAGLGTSKDGAALAEAYKSGNTFDYVMKNVNKLSIGNVPDDAEFRVCIGAYDESNNVNYGVINQIFNVVSKSGVEGLTQESIEFGDVIFEKSSATGESKVDEATRKATDPDTKWALQCGARNMKLGAVIKKLEGIRTKITASNPKVLDAMNDAIKLISGYTLAQHYSFAEKQEITSVTFDVGKQAGVKDGVMVINKGWVDTFNRKIGKTIDNLKTIKDANSISFLDAVKTDGEQIKANFNDMMNSIDTFFKSDVGKWIKSHSSELKKAGITAGAVAGTAALAGVAAMLWNAYQKNKSNITFAAITFVNENKPDGLAQVRLFVRNSVTNTRINGRDKIAKLRDRMLEVADELAESARDMDTKAKDQVLTVSETINRFFSGLASKA